jgi:hypothetical protein
MRNKIKERERRRMIRQEMERRLPGLRYLENLDDEKKRRECFNRKPYDRIPDPTPFTAILNETRQKIYREIKDEIKNRGADNE